MSNWIKPKDKLPENEQEVLITVEECTELGGGIGTQRAVWQAVFYNDPLENWYPFFRTWIDDEKELTEDVVAWMPLPEPYTEE